MEKMKSLVMDRDLPTSDIHLQNSTKSVLKRGLLKFDKRLTADDFDYLVNKYEKYIAGQKSGKARQNLLRAYAQLEIL